MTLRLSSAKVTISSVIHLFTLALELQTTASLSCKSFYSTTGTIPSTTTQDLRNRYPLPNTQPTCEAAAGQSCGRLSVSFGNPPGNLTAYICATPPQELSQLAFTATQRALPFEEVIQCSQRMTWFNGGDFLMNACYCNDRNDCADAPPGEKAALLIKSDTLTVVVSSILYFTTRNIT